MSADWAFVVCGVSADWTFVFYGVSADRAFVVCGVSADWTFVACVVSNSMTVFQGELLNVSIVTLCPLRSFVAGCVQLIERYKVAVGRSVGVL